MRRASRWLRGIGPLDRRARLELAGCVAEGLLLALLLLVLDPSSPAGLLIVFGAAFAGASIAGTLHNWSAAGGYVERRRMRRAIRTGVLPEDVVLRVWLPALVRERRSRSGARVTVPVMTVVLAWVVSLRPGEAVGWLVAAVVLAGAAWTVWTFADAHRSVPRLDAMLLQLGRRYEAQLRPVG